MEGVVKEEKMNFSKDLRVEIPPVTVKDTEMRAKETELVTRAPTSGLMRHKSGKINCLCSPTTHAGSFRCRLHRSPSLQRTKSATFRESPPKENTGSTVKAQ